MAIPNPASILSSLVPRWNTQMCDRVGDGILGFMDADAQNWGYLFDPVTGAVTPAFAREICALPCASGGSTTCATIGFNFTGTSGDRSITVNFGGSNIESGDTWILYRSTTAGSFVGLEIKTGTFVGSNGQFVDDGTNSDNAYPAPSNGVPYYYKLVVSRATCADESVETQQPGWKPAACLNLGSTLVISSGPIDSGVGIKLQGRTSADYIPNGSTFKVYRSTQQNVQGSQIFSGTLPGDFGCTGDNGQPALCFTDTSATLVLGTTYYYQVTVTQSGCSPATFTTSSQRGTAGGGTSAIGMVAGCSNNEHQTNGNSSNIAIAFTGLTGVQYYIVYATSVKYGLTVNSKIYGTQAPRIPGQPSTGTQALVYSGGGNSANTWTMTQLRGFGIIPFACLNNGALAGSLDVIGINGAALTAALAAASVIGTQQTVEQEDFYGTDITYTLAPYYFTGGEAAQSAPITVPLT